MRILVIFILLFCLSGCVPPGQPLDPNPEIAAEKQSQIMALSQQFIAMSQRENQQYYNN